MDNDDDLTIMSISVNWLYITFGTLFGYSFSRLHLVILLLNHVENTKESLRSEYWPICYNKRAVLVCVCVACLSEVERVEVGAGCRHAQLAEATDRKSQ